MKIIVKSYGNPAAAVARQAMHDAGYEGGGSVVWATSASEIRECAAQPYRQGTSSISRPWDEGEREALRAAAAAIESGRYEAVPAEL